MDDMQLLERIVEEKANWPHQMVIQEQDLPNHTIVYSNLQDLCADLSDYDDEFTEVTVTIKLKWR